MADLFLARRYTVEDPPTVFVKQEAERLWDGICATVAQCRAIDATLPRSTLARTIYSRFTLLGLSSVETLMQRWTGEVWVELSEVMELSQPAFRYACGDNPFPGKAPLGDRVWEWARTSGRDAELEKEAMKALYPLNYNNVVEKIEPETWLSRNSLDKACGALPLPGEPLDTGKGGQTFKLRGWKTRVLTSISKDSGTMDPAAFRQCTLGELLLEEVWRQDRDAGRASSQSEGGAVSGAGAKPSSAPTFIEFLRRKWDDIKRDGGDKWRSWNELNKLDPPGAVLNTWFSECWGLAKDGTLGKDSSIMLSSFRSDKGGEQQKYRKGLLGILKSFSALSYSFRTKSTYEHAFSLESFPTDIQHPMIDISLQIPLVYCAVPLHPPFTLFALTGSLALSFNPAASMSLSPLAKSLAPPFACPERWAPMTLLRTWCA